MSASINPTRYPSLPSETARFTATVVFPTPPLPLPIATTCATPGKGCGPCGAPCPAAAIPTLPFESRNSRTTLLPMCGKLLNYLVGKNNHHPHHGHDHVAYRLAHLPAF